MSDFLVDPAAQLSEFGGGLGGDLVSVGAEVGLDEVDDLCRLVAQDQYPVGEIGEICLAAWTTSRVLSWVNTGSGVEVRWWAGHCAVIDVP